MAFSSNHFEDVERNFFLGSEEFRTQGKPAMIALGPKSGFKGKRPTEEGICDEGLHFDKVAR
jgi:hypothetical protein